MRRLRGDDGMTLIEMLVVFVVVGVLASIALPTLMKQRYKAYESATRSELRTLVTAQLAWSSSTSSYTDDLAELEAEGYRPTQNVTTHVAVAGDSFVACSRYGGMHEWIVYDSTTAQTSRSAADCA